ncbi:unnamed protein product [Prorocentrum cordatum]|uniref:Phosphoglycerate mutase (2,3-diphosphoglycerate-dependent) n=1 Tax=Prorocentrum cordatum TaxID=2364126 RepID=A0ABN9R8Y0_9DINO|nr:unnamed protein product [Polarella glacialis]
MRLPAPCRGRAAAEPDEPPPQPQPREERGRGGPVCGAWRPPRGTASEALPEAGAEAAAERRSTRLLLVRHGETLWNTQRRMQGQLDIDLNEVGVRQAQQVADALRRLGVAERVEAVVSSDLSRASRTADIIAGACPSASRRADADLREVHFGVLQGERLDDPAVECQRARVHNAWRRGDFHVAVEGGETVDQLTARGLRGLRSACGAGAPGAEPGAPVLSAPSAPRLVVVVAHAGVIKWCAVRLELGGEAPSPEAMSRPAMRELLGAPVRNCCVSSLLYDHEADAFCSEGWFQTIEEGSRAREDCE